MPLSDLHEQIAAVCPINGVSVGRIEDKATWRVDFKPIATAQQRADAQAILAGFDVSAPSDPDKLSSRDFDEMPKALKAAVLLMRNYANALKAGTYTNKTLTDLKADYITAWKSVP